MRKIILQIISVIFTLTILLAFGYFVLSSLDSEITVAIIAAAATISVSVISFVIG